MFLRFVSVELCEDSQCRLGIFQVAYDLLDSNSLLAYEQDGLLETLEWFDENLDSPSRFSRSLKGSRQPGSICWFRSSAKEHLARIWQMAGILESNAVPIWMLKTSSPGKVVYEDEFQIVAEPYTDLRRRI